MDEQGRFQYDLFVSYSRADRAWVHGYLLPALNLPPDRLITPQDFQPGAAIVGEFERAVVSSRITLLVLSPAFLADEWATFGEQLAAYAGVAEQRDRLVPLLIEPCELPLRLEFRVRLDCTNEDDWEGEIARLRALLGRPEPGPERIPCPYPGMVPFTEQDAPRFFGRDREIEALRRQLRYQNYLFVIGPSGSGKSSLVFAGLIPSLHAHQPGEWLIRALRPGAMPLQALQEALPSRPFRRLLLVIDQLEELFTQAPRPSWPEFIAALKELRQVPGCTLLLTLRADFYPDLMNSDLWPVAAEERLEIAPLRGAALREAIVRPAEALGVYVEPELVERLLADAADEPGVLPLLQETMALLWEKRERRLLSLRAYDRLGADGRSGLTVAMATRADAAMAVLPPAGQAMARRILLRLVQFGEGRADTRRRQPIEALRSADDEPSLFERILDHLADNRLLTLSGGEGTAGPLADLAHEALIAGWPTLQGWIRERREAEQARRRLEVKAGEWMRLGQGSGGLLDEVELREADRWLESPDAADLGYGEALTALVEASRRAIEATQREKEAARQRELALERRGRQRLWGIIAILGLLVLVGLAWLARQELLRQSARWEGKLCPVPGLSVDLECNEVSNRRYALCVEAGRCSPPPRFDPRAMRDSALPVTEVDALQAAAFCDWIGRRLPTRTEWLAAATQGGLTTWPWGEEEPTPDRANLLYEPDSPVARSLNQVQPVGGRLLGATPQGIQDLIGNVWEWTATPWEKPGREGEPWGGDSATAPDRLVIEGGGYLTSITGLGTATQPIDAQVSFRRNELGFRCIKGVLPLQHSP